MAVTLADQLVSVHGASMRDELLFRIALWTLGLLPVLLLIALALQ